VSGSVCGRPLLSSEDGRGHADRTPTTLSWLEAGRDLRCSRPRQVSIARVAMSAVAAAGIIHVHAWWPVCGRRPDIRPGQIAADTGMAIDTSLATCVGHRPSGGRSFRKQRTVNPRTVPARYKVLYSSSRSASGRPPAVLGQRIALPEATSVSS
jgi:hypothetical protein